MPPAEDVIAMAGVMAERDKLKGEVKRLRERDKSGVSPEDWEQLNVLDGLRDENQKLREALENHCTCGGLPLEADGSCPGCVSDLNALDPTKGES